MVWFRREVVPFVHLMLGSMNLLLIVGRLFVYRLLCCILWVTLSRVKLTLWLRWLTCRFALLVRFLLDGICSRLFS